MLKMIDGRFCRKYGDENTHLTLTEKADKFYSETDPYHIYECETVDEAGDTVYLYTTRGFTDTPGVWMTERELNEMLETEADDVAEEIARYYFWTLESWGADYPPENADEIIEAANEKIAEYVKTREWKNDYEIERFCENLWDRYCSTGEI